MNRPTRWHSGRIIDSPTIDYGHGGRNRRTSRAALLALVLSLSLLGLAGAVCLAYFSPSSRLGGLGSGLLVIGLFFLLERGAVILVPISIISGVSALITIHRQPDRLRGRISAILGMLVSALVGTAVAYGAYEAHKAIAASQSRLNNSVEYRTYNERTELSRLLEDCQIYASRHDGAYPPDLITLSGTVAHDASVERDYIYCGQGLTDESSTDADHQRYHPLDINNSIIVLICARPTPDGIWIVGVKGNPHLAGIVYVRQSDLPKVLRRSNEMRESAALPPINFAKLLNRPELAEAPTTSRVVETK